jgi:hypothetical protein
MDLTQLEQIKTELKQRFYEQNKILCAKTKILRGQARGGRRRRPVRGMAAGVATSCPRASQQHWECHCSTWHGAAVAGLAAQG